MKVFPVKAVIFDLDGTLADTIGDLGGAVNSVLKKRGFPEHSLSTYKGMVGNGFSTLIERALPSSVRDDTDQVARIAREAAQVYAGMALATTKPFPGIPELLSRLRANAVVVAVLSNKPDHMTKAMILSLFPGIPFLRILGDKPGSPRKPDPSNALAIAALSGISAREWAFVGDSGVDMETGKASGMLPLGAGWGYRSEAELRDKGAETILERPADLLRFI